MKKEKQHAQHMATLRRERAIGGGISAAVDHILTVNEALVAALENAESALHGSIAYFPSDADEEELAQEIADALKLAKGEA